MILRSLIRIGAATTLAATAAVFAPVSVPAQTVDASTPACPGPSELIRLDNPLKRVGQELVGGQPITIVAIGSSSTFGAGASSPAMSYPSRLEAELKAHWPRPPSPSSIAARMARKRATWCRASTVTCFAENPDLVIWQVGSNSVLRDHPIDEANAYLREGLKRLKAAGADVILMNPQYAPKVIAKRDVEKMVDLIDATARETHVDLFQRFALMRYWRLTEDIPFSTFVSPDELHMNDWSYGCVAKLLADAIVEATTRSTVTATSVGVKR